MAKKRINQAVIVIHGIGEQKPMDTLRGFVDAVLPQPDLGEKYFSKPDPMSELFELRKLQNRKQPRTHFFEYYWAYHVEGTQLSHVWGWLKSMLFRRPGQIPDHLLPFWVLIWLLLITAIAAATMGAFDQFVASVEPKRPFLYMAISGGALALIRYFVTAFLGDAARYLSPNPENIALRRAIRNDGIELLRRIHTSGEYERIIVVGHSLGSVIAYDIIRHLWQEYHDVYGFPHPTTQPALAKLEQAGERLDTDPSPQALNNFRAAQMDLWVELGKLDHPWLVTDLITLGSPLAHAALVMADGKADLSSRKRQRELPICPPVGEIEKRKGQEHTTYSFRLWDSFEKRGMKYSLRALHHAAPFACTRWTNLYFPVRLAFLGDIIGGAMQCWFGRGILDYPVTSSRWSGLAQLTPLAHTSYWWQTRNESPPSPTEKDSLRRLTSTLDLEWKNTPRRQ